MRIYEVECTERFGKVKVVYRRQKNNALAIARAAFNAKTILRAKVSALDIYDMSPKELLVRALNGVGYIKNREVIARFPKDGDF